MSATTPRVFTIPPTAPFLRALARGILDGKVIAGFTPRESPELLADLTIYLPTRRAARALAGIFLEETASRALLLPRIVPLGDVDEDAFAFEADDLAPLPPAIAASERRLALATLVQGFAAKEFPLLSASPGNAIALADELAHLIDDFITADLPFGAVAGAVEGELDRYWERSRDFLKIVSDHWDTYLAGIGKIDAAKRRDLLLAREAERLAKGSGGPVIAAGSTGTVPKVAALLAVIAKRKNGAVVLPGLDQLLPKDAFALIGAEHEPMPGHPQFGLKRLIERVGIAREAVEPLAEPSSPAREALLSRAFEPYVGGAMREPVAPGALDGITLIEAQDAREEALAIAIALRESLHNGTSAALITPDRALARRVCAELSRWNIAIDDSAGMPLADSEAGRLARLLAEAASSDAAPSVLLALLRHPYLRHRFAAEDVALLEICALRGLRPAGGAKNLSHIIEAARRADFHYRDLRAGVEDADWDRAKATAASLEALLSPLLAVREGTRNFLDLVQAHRAVVLAALADDAPEECEALIETLDALCESGNVAPAMQLSDYAGAFAALIRESTLRPPQDEDAWIRILGPLEARMINAERVVLGGLCEGVWPPEAHVDSWLNRPMRKNLKLDLPERRIGLSAHDFVQAAGATEIFLVRARKQGGVETIASRFLQRLEAVSDLKAWQQAKASGERYLHFARSLEDAPEAEALLPPMPKPPATARPRRFSMSDMRDLTRDPYSIFARKILRLNALDGIDEEPGAAERGTLLHEIVSEFTKRHPGAIPPHALDDMIEIARRAFAPMQSYPAAFAIWWPRFERAAKWFVEMERERRHAIEAIHSEVSGTLEIGDGKDRFTLTARADRIEVNKDGSIAVLDFKTGRPPTYKEAILGFEPQLLLEAAIVLAGGFPGIAGTRLSETGAIKISGGRPPGDFKPFELSNRTDFKAVAEPRGIAGDDHLEIAAQRALDGAARLLQQYADPATPYPFAPRVQQQKDYNDYKHLARYKEWSEGGE
jgi:ATP-dependent helicase/nuclease subunit B